MQAEVHHRKKNVVQTLSTNTNQRKLVWIEFYENVSLYFCDTNNDSVSLLLSM